MYKMIKGGIMKKLPQPPVYGSNISQPPNRMTKLKSDSTEDKNYLADPNLDKLPGDESWEQTYSENNVDPNNLTG